MKPGQLTTKPLRVKPENSGIEKDLARLETLESWTEEPTRNAAAIIADAVQDAAQKAPQQPASKQAEQKKRYPWQDGNSAFKDASMVLKPMNIRAPIELHQKLKWLSDNRIDGKNLTRIIIEALEEKVEKMMKERGVNK
jgi:hypothetical protein